MLLVHPAVVKQDTLAAWIIDELVPANGPPLPLLIGPIARLFGGVFEFDPGIGRQFFDVLGTGQRRGYKEKDDGEQAHSRNPHMSVRPESRKVGDPDPRQDRNPNLLLLVRVLVDPN